MRRVAQTLLVACAILCALTLSASSTIRLAAAVDVPGWAHPFAVGLLEVTAVTGTWVWLTEPRVRWEAAGAVLMASTVTGIGGVLAYGAFGLVAPIGLIVTVHVIARAWTTQTPVQEPGVLRADACRLDSTEGPGPDGLTGRPDPGPPTETSDPQLDQVRAIVEKGGGRGTVAEELGVSPNQARTLITRAKAA